MIKKGTKTELLKELAKIGNVFSACYKVGVGRTTYYRWYNKDKKFKEKADEAIHIGRANIVDLAEHGLSKKIQEGYFPAIKFTLVSLTERYRKKSVSVTLSQPAKSMEDELAEMKWVEDNEDYEKQELATDSVPTL
ncbi:MAG: hypothetical protein WC052_03730 [Patescibacteria group bacterium]|jgi:hypothetical protein